MRWVVQNNLGQTKDVVSKIQQAWSSMVICMNPSSDSRQFELPEINNKSQQYFMGQRNFINNIYKSNRWNPGTFFNEKFHNKGFNTKIIKGYMMNHPCELTTIGAFCLIAPAQDDLFFVRPVKDLKEFARRCYEIRTNSPMGKKHSGVTWLLITIQPWRRRPRSRSRNPTGLLMSGEFSLLMAEFLLEVITGPMESSIKREGFLIG